METMVKLGGEGECNSRATVLDQSARVEDVAICAAGTTQNQCRKTEFLEHGTQKIVQSTK